MGGGISQGSCRERVKDLGGEHRAIGEQGVVPCVWPLNRLARQRSPLAHTYTFRAHKIVKVASLAFPSCNQQRERQPHSYGQRVVHENTSKVITCKREVTVRPEDVRMHNY